MTAPVSNEEFLRLSDQAQEELLRQEQTAAELAAGPLRRWLALVKAKALTLWPGDDAPAETKISVGLQLAGEIENAELMLDVLERALIAAALAAAIRGAVTATQMARLGGLELEPSEKSAGATAAAKSAISVYRSTLATARGQVLAASTAEQLAVGTDLAYSVASRAEALSAATVADAYHDSLAATASASPDVRLVWRAERGACLSCLAYAGETVIPGDAYPGGLTYGDKPLSPPGTGVRPPLHPYCRCEQIVWSPGWGSGPTTLPDALRREAQRSVLRGWSDASGIAGARAARRLLDSGVDAPASVLRAAERLANEYGV